jgi:hypothetical protein
MKLHIFEGGSPLAGRTRQIPSANRPVATRPITCLCGRRVDVRSVTSPHPEAPEMISVPADTWVGFVNGDHAPEMVLCCSERCVQLLLEEG